MHRLLQLRLSFSLGADAIEERCTSVAGKPMPSLLLVLRKFTAFKTLLVHKAALFTIIDLLDILFFVVKTLDSFI